MDDDYPFIRYPYTNRSTLYICHGCKRAISTRTSKVYFRNFLSFNYNTGKVITYKEPFCKECNKNPDTWWCY